MASVSIKLTVTSNKITLPIDDIFVGKYVKITISSRDARLKTKRPMKRIGEGKKHSFKLPKVDTSKFNTNFIEDEPNWNSNKPLDKDFDIPGHSEKKE